MQKKDPELNAETTLTLINQVLHHYGYDYVLTTLMPRASVQSWGVIKQMFDCDRTWVFTDNHQEDNIWEKAKSSFYASQGEKIKFVPINKNISGTLLRELIQHKNYERLGEYLPSDVIKFYKNRNA